MRKANVPFGFIFTLTLHNLPELEWVAAFASEEGAALLQVHPLELVGRAREVALYPPDDLELSYAFLEVARLQRRYGDRLTLQLDVADRTLITEQPWRVFAIDTPDPAAMASVPLASLVSPLILQDDGVVVPIQYGFAPQYAVARLGEAEFPAAAQQWKRDRYPEFLALARAVWRGLQSSAEHVPFTNWYSAIMNSSYSHAP